KAIISPASYAVIDELVDLLNDKKTVEIELAGHTDSDGTAAHNLQLSKDRAAAVRAYLLKKGIASGRVTSTGYGETRPVADNATPSGKAQNRRTEVRVTAQ
ncbi:MAG: OmpA family protein, partial [Bacteroidota bacterium]